MRKNRHLERRETLAYWEARRADTGALIGRVANINEEGLNLHSTCAFQPGEQFPVRVILEPSFAGVTHIDLEVQNVWCRKVDHPSLFHEGFKILRIPREARDILKKMLMEFSFAIPANVVHA